MPPRTSATAFPKPDRTTARQASTRALARARPTTMRWTGSTSPKALARRSAARWQPRSPRVSSCHAGGAPSSSAGATPRKPMPATPLPIAAGIGLRAPHVAQIRAERPAIAWLEVHSENYFVDGGPALTALDAIRSDYAVSLHGVGLSLGSADPLDRTHLSKLRDLADRIEPAAVSEHLCWGHVDGRHLNDLLPLPFTDEALDIVCDRVDKVQAALGRPIL